jgi:glycosyltransferase involved in cell wall biosynthesis
MGGIERKQVISCLNGVRGLNVANSNQGKLARRSLDRLRWHQPLCTVIVTHHDYSKLVEDALLSLLDQTHENWECVVVDDFSTDDERRSLKKVVEGLSDQRMRLIENAQQLGQTETFFAGLAQTSGEFVSPLDPDDRLAPTYLEEMVAAHLNEAVFCPVVSCDQKLFRLDGALVTGTWKGRLRSLPDSVRFVPTLIKPDDQPLLYFPCTERNWLWSSSSGIMARRSALNLLVPNKRLGLDRNLDAYIANGAHFLGGTLFLSKPLLYRGMHAHNYYLTENIFSMQQNLGRADWKTRAPQFKRDVVEAMFYNGVTHCLAEHQLAEVLRAHFDKDQMALLSKTCPEAYRLWRPPHGLVRRVMGRIYRRGWKSFLAKAFTSG